MITREENELGEVYEWEFIPTQLATWDEATRNWDATLVNQPWDTFGVAGGWHIRTTRELHLDDSDSYAGVFTYKRGRLVFEDFHLNNDYNNYAIQQVEIENKKLSLAEIRNLAKNSSPVDYEEFRPLIPGEYTYEKALIGIRMRRNNAGVVVGFEGAVLNVDVEDVVDKGTIEVTSTDKTNPTVVRYGKWYYKKPEELMFSVSNYSEPCVVEVLTSDDKGFSIMLRSTIDNTKYVTGTVHWLANGY